MALNALALVKLFDRLEPGQAIASMGYPDIIFPQKRLAEFLGDRFKDLKYRPDSEAVSHRHSLKKRDIPDAESLFELFGCSLDVYDIQAETGSEIILDLNKPFPANSREQYDYVLDVGTLEHCFNVAQAAMNMAAMVKVGGFIFHENPWNWGNHGFYSLQPTWFYDFYGDNGFEIESCRLMRRDYQSAPATAGRFVYTEDEVLLETIAKRVEAKDFVFPVQGKYRDKE